MNRMKEGNMSNKHVIRVLDGTGDSVTEFDPAVGTEVNFAKDLFDKLKGQNYLAYKTDGPSNAEVIKSFDPTASETIMHKPLVGG